MTDEERKCLELMTDPMISGWNSHGRNAIVAALAEIDRLSEKLASSEVAESTLEELGQQLTEAAQSLGIDPDGLNDSEVIRAIVSRPEWLP